VHKLTEIGAILILFCHLYSGLMLWYLVEYNLWRS